MNKTPYSICCTFYNVNYMYIIGSLQLISGVTDNKAVMLLQLLVDEQKGLKRDLLFLLTNIAVIMYSVETT